MKNPICQDLTNRVYRTLLLLLCVSLLCQRPPCPAETFPGRENSRPVPLSVQPWTLLFMPRPYQYTHVPARHRRSDQVSSVNVMIPFSR